MKHNLPSLALLLAAAVIPVWTTSCSRESVAFEAPAASAPASKGDPAADFVASYRKALAAKDTATLDSFLMTEGAPEEIVGFFKMMRDMPTEGTPSVELITPSAEEAAKFNKPQEMPDGKLYKLPATPTHMLVVTSESKEGESTSKSTSSFPVLLKDGRFVIPLPVPAA